VVRERTVIERSPTKWPPALVGGVCLAGVMGLVVLLGLVLAAPAWAENLAGQVLDAATGKPIVGAHVTSDGNVVQTDGQGVFRLTGAGEAVKFRAPGYLRKDVPAQELTAVIRLEPFSPKAVYLSVFGIGTSALRESALRLIDETELNAVVIDVKGDRGIVSYRSVVSPAAEIGAQDIITIKDVKALALVAGVPGLRVRPQALSGRRDPSPDQRRGETFGSNGWMMWNPQNVYSREGLREK
jgi:Putative glycosyl hydrolase domain